jgi:hypothetical protein
MSSKVYFDMEHKEAMLVNQVLISVEHEMRIKIKQSRDM